MRKTRAEPSSGIYISRINRNVKKIFLQDVSKNISQNQSILIQLIPSHNETFLQHISTKKPLSIIAYIIVQSNFQTCDSP